MWVDSFEGLVAVVVVGWLSEVELHRNITGEVSKVTTSKKGGWPPHNLLYYGEATLQY